MTLGELRAALRAMKGNASVEVPGIGSVLVQKGSLLEALGERFKSKSAETGFTLTDAGHLKPEWPGAYCREDGPPALADIEAAEQLDIEDAIAAASDEEDDIL